MIGAAETTKKRTDRQEVLHTFAVAAIDNARPLIFVVDDDVSAVLSAARILRLDGNSVETFGRGAEFLGRRQRFGPGCLVLNPKLPDMSGFEVQSALLAAADDIPVIFVGAVPDVASTVTAIKRGAVDYLVKPVPPETLLERVRLAVQEHRIRLKDTMQRRELMFRFGRLTAREREVAVLVADGMSNKEIASRLGTAEKTVKHHRARAMLKLGIDSVAQLVRMLDRLGDRLPF